MIQLKSEVILFGFKSDSLPYQFIISFLEVLSWICRSSLQRYSVKKVVPKNFTNFIGRSLQVFSCDLREIFTNTYLREHLRTTASEFGQNELHSGLNFCLVNTVKQIIYWINWTKNRKVSLSCLVINSNKKGWLVTKLKKNIDCEGVWGKQQVLWNTGDLDICLLTASLSGMIKLFDFKIWFYIWIFFKFLTLVEIFLFSKYHINI